MSVDPKELALANSLVGHRIERVCWYDANPDIEWTGHEECLLLLDDGRVIRFEGIGYDSWAATISETTVADPAVRERLGLEKEEESER